MRRLATYLIAVLTVGSCSEPIAPPEATGVALVLSALTPLEQTVPITSGVPTAFCPRVRVTDAAGNPVRGVVVRFLITRGQPSISAGATTTNAAGEAWLSGWAAGTRAGVQEVTAILATNTSDTRAVFKVNVPPGLPVTVGPDRDSTSVAVGGTSRPVVLVRRDVHGNVVDTLSGTTVLSDDPGIVAITASDSILGVAEGRSVILLENGIHRFGVVAITGGVAARVAVAIASNPNAGYAVATAPGGLAYAVGFFEYEEGDLYRIEPGAQVASTIAWTPGVTRILDAAFSPDGTRAYFTSQSSGLVVVDATTDAVVDVVTLPHDAQRVATTSDGAYVIVTGWDRFSRVATSDLSFVTFDLPWQGTYEATNGIALHPTASTVYLSNYSGFVAAVDYLSGAVLHSTPVGPGAQGLALDLARSRLIVAREYDGLRVLDAGTLDHLFDSMPVAGAFDVRFDPLSDDVWVTRSLQGTVDRYTSSLTRPAERIGAPDPRRISIRPDGSLLVSARFGVRLIPAP
jgi:hypothetical protein